MVDTTSISMSHKVTALLSLMAVSTTVGVTFKLAQVSGDYLFSPFSVTAMTEAFKLCTSALIVARLVVKSAHEKGCSYAAEMRHFTRMNFSITLTYHMFGLALAYTVVNIVTFGVFAHSPASTFFLLKASSPIITAIMLVVMVHRPISPVQWFSIVMQCLGLVITQYDPCLRAAVLTLIAYLYITINITVSCAAGVWNEHVIKSQQVSVNAINVVLYACGVLVNVLLYAVVPLSMLGFKAEPQSFFDGFTPAVGGIIVANGTVGLVITAVYKYADVLIKTFGLGAATGLLFSFEAIGLLPSGQHHHSAVSSVVGSVIVFYASYLYVLPPPAKQPPVVARAASMSEEDPPKGKEEGDEAPQEATHEPSPSVSATDPRPQWYLTALLFRRCPWLLHFRPLHDEPDRVCAMIVLACTGTALGMNEGCSSNP